MEAIPEGWVGCTGSSYWVMEDGRSDGVLKSNSLGAGIQIQAPLLPHNSVAVGPFFFPVLEPGLAAFPFLNLVLQQPLRLAKILMPVNSLCSSKKHC